MPSPGWPGAMNWNATITPSRLVIELPNTRACCLDTLWVSCRHYKHSVWCKSLIEIGRNIRPSTCFVLAWQSPFTKLHEAQCTSSSVQNMSLLPRHPLNLFKFAKAFFKLSNVSQDAHLWCWTVNKGTTPRSNTVFSGFLRRVPKRPSWPCSSQSQDNRTLISSNTKHMVSTYRHKVLSVLLCLFDPAPA